MILLYQVGKWVAANFKSLSTKSTEALFVGGRAAVFTLLLQRERHSVPAFGFITSTASAWLSERSTEALFVGGRAGLAGILPLSSPRRLGRHPPLKGNAAYRPCAVRLINFCCANLLLPQQLRHSVPAFGFFTSTASAWLSERSTEALFVGGYAGTAGILPLSSPRRLGRHPSRGMRPYRPGAVRLITSTAYAWLSERSTEALFVGAVRLINFCCANLLSAAAAVTVLLVPCWRWGLRAFSALLLGTLWL